MAIHCGRLDAAQATVTLTIRSSLIFMKFRLCRRTHWRQSRIRQLVAVDIVAKVEHVQLGRLCRKSVIFVAHMWNVLSTLSPVWRTHRQTNTRVNLYSVHALHSIGQTTRVWHVFLTHTVYPNRRSSHCRHMYIMYSISTNHGHTPGTIPPDRKLRWQPPPNHSIHECNECITRETMV